MTEQSGNSSLSGYRVLDIADAKGMFCARLLADMGAAVTRVEPPGAPPRDDPEYCYLNAGKSVLSLDLEQPAGQAELREMVKNADVLVETGQLQVSYEELSFINPGLVMVSITGASDLVAQATGGWLSVTGEPDRPLKLYGDQACYTASLFAANGILLALLARRETGRGQHLDVSLQACVAATLDHVLVRYLHQNEIAVRTGSRYWNGAFRILPCRDGYVLVSWQQHWETLVEWLQSEGMAEDLAEARWRDEQVRRDNAEHIAAVLEEWTLAHDAAELVATAQLMRFPWAKVATPVELAASPQHAARGYLREIQCPRTGRRYAAPGSPLRKVP